ncbi:HAD family hydrolase [Flammeovirga aprica]|uniref:Haloacid dehalogenase-like hydrolase n=1 Tax=Flammeovirga aprica JL-4 TaxID=694437 RepID=A0A7X9P2G5_9BACT|nr:HAD family hydrolase [Flammeovirga aprica]NME68331.1 haloacid dehalogenase-like hydrolase [Flammeovirga aprica JL-4]
MKFFLVALFSLLVSNMVSAQELQSWNEPMRSELIKMVKKAPKKGRVATFDMDGTMISESPTYEIALFTKKYSKADIKSKDDLVKALVALTKDENYKKYVDEYFADNKAKVYQPMLELVEYLKANDFKVILCTASEEYFAQVAAKTSLPMFDDVIGTNMSVRVNEYEGKVQNLKEAGYQPMFAFGNSAGDYEMMEYATKKSYLVIHDHKASGEYAKPEQYVSECKDKGFGTINISDWTTIFQ